MVADDDDDEDEEEELVDPMEALREQCSKDAHSLALLDELAKCTERVESRTMTEETCTQVNNVPYVQIKPKLELKARNSAKFERTSRYHITLILK